MESRRSPESIDACITALVYNSPDPMDIDDLANELEEYDKTMIVSRAMLLSGDGMIQIIVHNGVTYFTP